MKNIENCGSYHNINFFVKSCLNLVFPEITLNLYIGWTILACRQKSYKRFYILLLFMIIQKQCLNKLKIIHLYSKK